MTVWIVLGSILAFILLISLLRVGVSAEYSADGVIAKVHIGPVSITLYPQEKKKEKKKKPKEKKKEPKPGLFEDLKSQLPAIKKALSRLKRKLLIKELTIYYLAAGPDPAAAALTFGGVYAGYGIITAILENNFRIKKRDLRANVDFEAQEPYIYIKARLSLAIWEAVYAAFNLVMSMATGKKIHKKPNTTIRKAV